jgi:hypothetical protein
MDVLSKIADFPDWRPSLALILQPVPFTDSAISSTTFLRRMGEVITKMINDPRCDVHQLVLGVRDGKDGWFEVFSPSRHDLNDAAVADGVTSVWIATLSRLFSCCCRRKKFVGKLVPMVGTVELLALRDTPVAQEVLCFMLEYDMVESRECQMQLVTTLESIPSGREAYARLLERRSQLEQLRQK